MKLKSLIIGAMILCITTSAFADDSVGTVGTESKVGQVQSAQFPVMSILAMTLTVPAQLLSVPHWGAMEALHGINRIQDPVLRTASLVALAPLTVPAEILNFPSSILNAVGISRAW